MAQHVVGCPDMSFLVLQLSDIHIRQGQSFTDRADAIARAITGSRPIRRNCLILFTGDIANSGDEAEYVEAAGFLAELKRVLVERGTVNLHFATIPGNHDCNLRVESDTRRFLLESIEAYLSREIDYSGTNFRALSEVQDNFFTFEQQASDRDQPIEGASRLYYKQTFVIEDRTVLVHCFNTAWLSKRHEEQAKLFFPTDLLRENTPPAAALSLVILHHPYNWLNAENARRTEAFVSANADIVLSGHEHEAAVAFKSHMPDGGVMYFSAPALNDPTAPETGFQMADIDFDQSTMEVVKYVWSRDSYQPRETQTWPFARSSQRPQNPFAFRADWSEKLNDVGTGFNHPRCSPPNCKLRLSDLYVFPDLRRSGMSQAVEKDKNAVVQGQDVLEALMEHPRVFLSGVETSGKSSLAKVLTKELYAKGKFPVLINGSNLKRKIRDQQVLKVISDAIETQYSASSSEAFWQAGNMEKCLVIDDWDDAKLSLEGQKDVLSILEQRFPQVIVFASDIFKLQDESHFGRDSALVGYERFIIRQFGSFHRHKLIRKWLAIGRVDIEELGRLTRDVQETDKTVATLLGRNVLPHHPVTILTLLQMLQSKDVLNTANGAYGYLYETLLKASLAKINPRKVDEMITYLSRVGYAMFKSTEPVLSEEEFRDVHHKYCEDHDMEREFEKYVQDLKRAGVITEEFGAYTFKYPYEYFYSVAKYYVDQGLGLRAELVQLADHLYNEGNANVLIFYVYLTKDVPLIQHMVAGAVRLYADHKPLRLDSDVSTIDRLCTHEPPPLVLESGSSEERRDAWNRDRDEADEQEQSYGQDESGDEIKELVQIGVAFRTLQILGQVLRNFTGSLEGPVKLEIVRECCSLGMRTLAFILGYMQDVEGIRQYIGSLIAERTGITDEKKLAGRTDDVIVWLSRAATFGAIKRISYAVGHVDLIRTYIKMLSADSSNSARMIDAVIKMDHMPNAPESELRKLSSDLKRNPFASIVMRDLVADYLYLYEHDFRVMQRVGAQWNIKVQQAKYLTNRSKG